MKLTSSLLVLVAACLGLAPGLQAQSSQKPKLKGYFAYKPARAKDVEAAKAQIGAFSPSPGLPLWTYVLEASRDDNAYTGVIVGDDPSRSGNTSVPTYVLPLILQTDTIGTSYNTKTAVIGTSPGTTIFNSAAPDNGCLSAPNNVPSTLVMQSPILQNATFNFGGSYVGTTQYVDAFQRANFWQLIGASASSDYHVHLTPRMLAPIFINVPARYGTTIPQSTFPSCGPLGIVDINWFDTYITNQVLPALASQGVKPATFPILLVHNVVWSSLVTNLDYCCILGYHGTTLSAPIQTYSPADFDTTGLFPSALQDTGILSHEVAEWVNDPYGNNLTPAWGHTGQVGGCQNNLEVGDPLTGSNAPPIYMPNGFTYHLQELAFFSWFFGQPSIGIHNWFSNNATFLTDAGPVCVSPPASASSATTDEQQIIVVK